jgi:uroporphyrinogen-III synthase
LGKHSRSLAGKTIVVTRAPEQSQELSDALEALGAEVLRLPMVAFLPPENSDALDSALMRFTQFDWIVFTSQNAVRFVFRRGCQLDKKRKVQPARPRVAAVGAATAQAARNLDIRVDYVAQTQTGESLAAELRDEIAGASILLPRSDLADDRVPAALREAGAKVEEVVVYRTAMPGAFDPAILESIRTNAVNVIIFASPSAFDNFRKVIAPLKPENLSTHIKFAAIGPTTASAIRESGVAVAIESTESSVEGVASAIAAYYENSPSLARHS